MGGGTKTYILALALAGGASPVLRLGKLQMRKKTMYIHVGTGFVVVGARERLSGYRA